MHIRIMERACCVINIPRYVNVHGYHEYKIFWDAFVGEVHVHVSGRGTF